MSEFAQNFRVSGCLSKHVHMLPSELTKVCITYRSQNGLWSSRQIKSVGIVPQCMLFNIILSSAVGYPKWFLPYWFPDREHLSSLPHVQLSPCISSVIIWRRVQSMNLLSSRKYLHLPVPSSHLGTNIFPSS